MASKFNPLLVMFFCVIMTSCNNSEDPSEMNTEVEKTTPSTDISGSGQVFQIDDLNVQNFLNEGTRLTEKNLKDNALLIIGDDRSGSTSVNRKLTLDDYKKILESFGRFHTGTVAVRVIGNPKNDNLEFHRMSLTPFYQLLPSDPNVCCLSSKNQLTLTELETYKLSVAKIKQENDKIGSLNRSELDRFIEVIENDVINYTKGGKDVTDINDALLHINQIINEKIFESYSKIYVILLSDGIHDADNKKVENFQTRDGVQIHLVGWKNKEIFTSPYSYESKEGLLNSSENIFSN